MAKIITNKQFPGGNSLPSSFDVSEVNATLRDKGVHAVYEQVILCPCKSKPSSHLNNCDSCGGTGWAFVNPIATKLIITGMGLENKLKEAAFREWGMADIGFVNVTGYNDEKFAFMDKITLTEVTSEFNQLIYPSYNDDDTNQFAFTSYKIEEVKYLGQYIAEDQKWKKLEEGEDFTFRENIIELDSSITDSNLQLTIRFVHHPIYHIINVLRESFTSHKGQLPQGQETQIMPIKAIAQRADLILDIQNYTQDRILDNSWLPNACEAPSLTDFQRQVKYTAIETLYSYLTAKQKQALDDLLAGSV